MRRLIDRQKIRKQDKEAFKKELVTLKKESQEAYEDFRSLWSDKHRYIGLNDILVWQEKYKKLHDRVSIALHSEDFKFLVRLFRDSINIVPKMYKYIAKFRRKHNKSILNSLRNENINEYFTINNCVLTKEQRTAIVMDEKRILTIGTGTSGLTLTCVAKAKYLVNKKSVSKDNIVFLTDSDKHAECVNNILDKEIDGLKANTFIEFSKKLIKDYGKEVPLLKTVNYEKFAEEYIVKLLDEDFYKKRFIDYYVNFRQAGYVVFDFDDVDDYLKFLDEFPPVTLDGVKVKNYEHLAVADFLYRNNIMYRYMDEYCISASEHDGSIYRPTFYLPDFDIYIEVFEINAIGEARFEKNTSLLTDTPSEIYRKKMSRIRELHEKNNTILVEAYTYEKMDNTLVDHLQQKLLKYGVVFALINTEDLLNTIFNQNPVIIRELSVIVAELLQLARDNSHTWEEIMNLNRGIALTKAAGYKRNESLIALLVPVYEEYMNYLGNETDDFGLINLAAETIRLSKKDPGYSYIIVDSFENINRQRFNLLKSIWEYVKVKDDGVIYCAGNDWQCKSGINAFDMTYFNDFSRFFGHPETVKFTRIFLQGQGIWSANARFIERNTEQIKKYGKCVNGSPLDCFTALSYTYVKDDKSNDLFDEKEIELMRDTLQKYINLLPNEYSVILVGRFMEDTDLAERINLTNIPIKTVYNLDQSADVVILINARRHNMGFPDRMMGERVRDLFGIKPEYYPFAAERRLWHQVISRAKVKVAFLYNTENRSRFIDEFF